MPIKRINRRAESPGLSSLEHVPAIPEAMSSAAQNSNPLELDSSKVVLGKKVEYIDVCDAEEIISEVVSEKEVKDFAASDALEQSDCMLLETTKECYEALERDDFVLLETTKVCLLLILTLVDFFCFLLFLSGLLNLGSSSLIACIDSFIAC